MFQRIVSAERFKTDRSFRIQLPRVARRLPTPRAKLFQLYAAGGTGRTSETLPIQHLLECRDTLWDGLHVVQRNYGVREMGVHPRQGTLVGLGSHSNV